MNAQAQQNVLDVGAMLTVGGFAGCTLKSSGRRVCVFGAGPTAESQFYIGVALCTKLRARGFRIVEIKEGASWSVSAER